MTVVRLKLPFPPSVNNLFLNVGKRRVRTPRYLAWEKLAGQWLFAQCVRPILGRYHMTILAQRPDRRARDLDNLIKPVADRLVKYGVIEDDHLAQSITISWAGQDPQPDAWVEVTIVPVAQAQAVAA